MQAGWDGFNRRDLSAIPSVFHEDLDFRPALGELAPEVTRGHEGIERWWKEQWATFDEATGTPEQLIAIGDHALAITRFEVRGRMSRLPLARHAFQVCQIRDGRMAWLYHSFDAADALRVLAERLEA